MADLPLVSIHIITYNQIDFIHETLTSALEQDYANLEVVVADDGSTDGTAEVIVEYAKKYPNRLLPLVGGPNLGITGNSNRGLKGCKGKYIAFQGGDDVLLPGKISAQVAWMEEDESRVLCGHQVEVFYEDGSQSHVLTPKLPSGSGCKWLIENGVPYGATAILVRKNKIPEDGFDGELKVASDCKLWIDVIGRKGEFGYVEGVLAKYRKHSNNVTSKNKEACNEDYKKMFNILLEEHPIYKKSIQKGIANQIYYRGGMDMLVAGRHETGVYLFASALRVEPFFLKGYIRLFQAACLWLGSIFYAK